MVSFQCHGCGDVVKKPKLDQHRMRCHSGFDCIDCSTTFETPAAYKGHTSCISEAEKYQKSLYKGPKTGAPTTKPAPPTQTPATVTAVSGTPTVSERASNAQWGRSTDTTSSSNGGYPEGGRVFNARGGGWGQTRYIKTTGANDTPLGTPTRRSPISQPAPVKSSAAAVDRTTQAKTNGSLANGSHDLSKTKKRKSMSGDDMVHSTDEPSTKKAKKAQDAMVIEPAAVPLPASPTAEKEEKKSKKSKKDKKNDVGDIEMAPPSEESEKKKAKKKKRREEEAATAAVTLDADGEVGKKDKKKKNKEELKDVVVAESNGAEVNMKEKKKKKTEEGANGNDEPIVESESRKKKKEKKEEPAPDAMGVDAKGSPLKEKKHKKEKKDKHLKKSTAVAVS